MITVMVGVYDIFQIKTLIPDDIQRGPHDAMALNALIIGRHEGQIPRFQPGPQVPGQFERGRLGPGAGVGQPINKRPLGLAEQPGRLRDREVGLARRHSADSVSKVAQGAVDLQRQQALKLQGDLRQPR